ncbi:MAG: Crp/Fnr family transcriptional regulator [Sphaerochaetaceae bacterium]|jgi:CRP/FNR family transcriptional regulator|nr:Crp/Fnr family transcriptional regulator [Sphaerochaetaceae bacterium]MDD3163528.1 Crp/Fnr family transcriptional regulator [Sphaerochaetaceae bacterium]MDD4007796.1 Crp/Fnr family transcriptional regulator [Sphaerochaetaceae bacterium]MDD4397139.1 Crp/Fnr family transcriptional regulator [Sphaerochaetaceae bacterium]
MERPTVECLKEHVECYDDFTDEEKRQVAQSSFLLDIKKGDTVLTSDSPCFGVMFIITGRLRTFLISDDGREVDLFYVDPGEVSVLTASCLIKAITFEVHVTADEDSTAILIPTSTFGKIQHENLRIENFVYRAANERFSDVMWTMQQMLFLPVQQRVAIYLHDECVRTGSCEIQTTHKQIAQALGTAREVVTRILRIMQQKHIISISRGSITVTDKKELQRETQ